MDKNSNNVSSAQLAALYDTRTALWRYNESTNNYSTSTYANTGADYSYNQTSNSSASMTVAPLFDVNDLAEEFVNAMMEYNFTNMGQGGPYAMAQDTKDLLEALYYNYGCIVNKNDEDCAEANKLTISTFLKGIINLFSSNPVSDDTYYTNPPGYGIDIPQSAFILDAERFATLIGTTGLVTLAAIASAPESITMSVGLMFTPGYYNYNYYPRQFDSI
jgi:hypothetical protein